MNIVILATAWGPTHGGVNAFNVDFAEGLAKYLGTRGSIICGVPSASVAEIKSAHEKGITLIPLNKRRQVYARFDPTWISEFVANKKFIPYRDKINYWVGHDIITGEAAKVGALTSSSAKSALIMHMDYGAYKSIQEDSAEVTKRSMLQRETFRNADFLFGNGPFLTRALNSMTSRRAVMLVPGFPEISCHTVHNEIRAVVFGRMDPGNDALKQVSLTAAAFGKAVRMIKDGPSEEIKEWHRQLVIFGISGKAQEKVLKELVRQRCGSDATVVLPLQYEKRAVIFDELTRANIAMMPSWHEGFGLAGWEAIAAETPLILSRNTGLWKLLGGEWGFGSAQPYVKLVEISGPQDLDAGDPFTPEDVDEVANAIFEIAYNMDEHIERAIELKWKLQKAHGCTWEHTAVTFLEALGVVSKKEPVEVFEGDWICFFVEGSAVRKPIIVKEDVHIDVVRPKKKIVGRSTYQMPDRGRTEQFFDMEARNGVLVGTTSVSDWRPQDGWGRFQVANTGAGNLLDGVVSWSSSLKTEVDWSRYIWVKNVPGNETLLAYAEQEMVQEIEIFKARLARRADGSALNSRQSPSS